MTKLQKWKPSSFSSLVLSQSLGALNDNSFKLLIVFHIISIIGIQSTQVITSIAGMCFVLPFILFSAIAGWLADRHSKRNVLIITKLLEILVVALGVLALSIPLPIYSYILIGLMGLQSTFFSPAKYGIIPEIMPKSKVSWANGWVSSTTYGGVIIGTFLGALLTDIGNGSFLLVGLFCLAVSIIGSAFAFGVEKTPVEHPGKPFPKLAILEPFVTLKITNKSRHLTLMIITSALFLFVGSFIQINILAFSIKHLMLDATSGGYIFLISALGIGCGAMIAGRLSQGIIELGIIPFSIALLGIGAIVSAIFASHLIVVIVSMFFLGLMGGFLTVPVEAFIQIRSPKKCLGQVLACNNFFNFIGILISSSTIYVLYKYAQFSPAQNFLYLGIFLILISIAYFRILKHFVYRFGWLILGFLTSKIEIKGKENIQGESPFLIFANLSNKKDIAQTMRELREFDFYIISSVSNLKKHADKLRKRSKSILLLFDCNEVNLDEWKSYIPHALDFNASRALQLQSIKKAP